MDKTKETVLDDITRMSIALYRDPTITENMGAMKEMLAMVGAPVDIVEGFVDLAFSTARYAYNLAESHCIQARLEYLESARIKKEGH